MDVNVEVQVRAEALDEMHLGRGAGSSLFDESFDALCEYSAHLALEFGTAVNEVSQTFGNHQDPLAVVHGRQELVQGVRGGESRAFCPAGRTKTPPFAS